MTAIKQIIDSNLPDNKTKKITEPVMRATLKAVVDDYLKSINDVASGHAASQPHGIFYMASDQSGKNQGSTYLPKLYEHHSKNELSMVQAINGNADIKAVLIPESGHYDTYCSIRTGSVSGSQMSLYFLKGRSQAANKEELLKWEIIEHSGVSDSGKSYSKMETVAVLPLKAGDMIIPIVSMYQSDIILEDYPIGVEVDGHSTNIVIQSGMELNLRKLYDLADSQEITLQLHGTITKNRNTGNFEAVNIDSSLIPQDAKDMPSQWHVFVRGKECQLVGAVPEGTHGTLVTLLFKKIQQEITLSDVDLATTIKLAKIGH